ncbi:MAG: cell division protein FtsL [Betaproteobacteria bacterium]
MLRLNIVLSVVLVLCALALITSQHKARELFSQLSNEQETAKQIDVEWGQLQLEQSTWAMHARIEKIASGILRMQLPSPQQVHFVSPGAASEPHTPPVKGNAEAHP